MIRKVLTDENQSSEQSLTNLGMFCFVCEYFWETATEVRFASFLSGEFTNMAVINPPERKLAKCTSVSTGLAGCVI